MHSEKVVASRANRTEKKLVLSELTNSKRRLKDATYPYCLNMGVHPDREATD